ncbi:hypothetical protein MAR_001489 [Mya arenaria]|nr:hypothetical protein MAR_001489 [Mya arenaria]
MILPLS